MSEQPKLNLLDFLRDHSEELAHLLTPNETGTHALMPGVIPTADQLDRIAALEQAFAVAVEAQIKARPEIADNNTVRKLQDELAATKHALAVMFKRYKESEQQSAFNKVDLNSIHHRMLVSELGKSKTEAAMAQKLAEERVADIWAKLSKAEDDIVDLEESMLTLRVENAALIAENDEFKLGQAEAERRALARRIALYPLTADPRIKASVKSRLVVRAPDGAEAGGGAKPVFAPALSTDETRFEADLTFRGRLSEGEEGSNPFVDDYDENEDDVVRHFSAPILAVEVQGEPMSPETAAHDRLFPDRGELEVAAMVELEIEDEFGEVKTVPLNDDLPPAHSEEEEEEPEWSAKLAHDLGVKVPASKQPVKPAAKLPLPPPTRNRRL